MGQCFIDSTSIDDENPYYLDWDNTALGRLEKREPTITQTAGGLYAVTPLVTAVKERRGKVCIWAAATDNLDKWRLESDMRALLFGAKKLHIGSRYLNVNLLGGEDPESDARRAPLIAGAVADFVATDPYWYLNQPLSGLGTPVNVGTEYSLYGDGSIPPSGLIPAFVFTANSFDIENWGNALTYAAGTITDGPASTTVYLRGVAGDDARLAVVLDAGGEGTFLAISEFRLDPGTNAIRVENAAGSLQAVGGTFSLSFGDTYMRFH